MRHAQVQGTYDVVVVFGDLAERALPQRQDRVVGFGYRVHVESDFGEHLGQQTVTARAGGSFAGGPNA